MKRDIAFCQLIACLWFTDITMHLSELLGCSTIQRKRKLFLTEECEILESLYSISPGRKMQTCNVSLLVVIMSFILCTVKN